MKQICLVVALLAAGCNREERPQAPTAEETERLDDAEAMLNELAANEEGPDNASAPSSPSN